MAKTKTLDPRFVAIIADFLSTHKLASTAKIFAAEAGVAKTDLDVPSLEELMKGWEILKGSVLEKLEGGEGEESGSEADTESDAETSETMSVVG